MEIPSFPDIDECASGEDNCLDVDDKGQCFNTNGSFICSCLPGYDGNGITSCHDVNECEEDLHNCTVNTNCVNTDGSYGCECKIGFIFDGIDCVDVDECLLDTSCVFDNSFCTNTEVCCLYEES